MITVHKSVKHSLYLLNNIIQTWSLIFSTSDFFTNQFSVAHEYPMRVIYNSIKSKYEETSYLKNFPIYRRCRWHRDGQNDDFTPFDWMSGIRSASGIRSTCLCRCPPLRWHQWLTPFTFEYLQANFRKILNGPLVYSESRGKLIHEKNLKSKTSCHCVSLPLMHYI